MDGTSMAAKASSDSTVSNGLISSLVTMYLPATLSFKTWIFSLNAGNFTFGPPFRSTVKSNCSELKWNGIIWIILVRMYERMYDYLSLLTIESTYRLFHLLFTEIFCTMGYRNFCSKASVQKFLCPLVQKNFCEK